MNLLQTTMARLFPILQMNRSAAGGMTIAQGKAVDTDSAIPAKLIARIAAIPGVSMVRDLPLTEAS
jgi:hypothetical protein